MRSIKKSRVKRNKVKKRTYGKSRGKGKLSRRSTANKKVKRKRKMSKKKNKMKGGSGGSQPSSDRMEAYEVLGLKSREATDDEIKTAYRKSALRWHPDKNLGDEKDAEAVFKAVSDAYGVLSDPEKRRIYDLMGWAGLEGAEPATGSRGGGGFAGRGYDGGERERGWSGRREQGI